MWNKYSGVEEVQELTMIVVEKFNNKTPWRPSPECHSNWNKLIRIFRWVVRFVNSCRIDREHKMTGELTVDEIKDAEKQIIKSAQKEAFQDEFVALQMAKPLPTTSKLLKLCPKLV